MSFPCVFGVSSPGKPKNLIERSGFISVASCKIKILTKWNHCCSSNCWWWLIFFFSPWNGGSLFIRAAKKQLQFLGDRQLTALCFCSFLDAPPSFPTCVFQQSQSFVVGCSRKILLVLFHNAAMVTHDSGADGSSLRFLYSVFWRWCTP